MIFISKKICEFCKLEYSNEKKYCPHCGSKNIDYIKSNDLLTNIQTTPNNFYESKIDNEIEKLNKVSLREKIGDIFEGKPKHEDISTNQDGYKTPKDKIKCPECSTENDLYSRFCGECGFPLKNLKICPNCGTLEEDSGFCEDCGTKLVDIKICPKCKHIMEFDAKFCGNCGNTF